MKKILILCSMVVVLFASCTKNNTTTTTIPPAPAVVPCFTVNDTATVDPSHLFVFTSCSQNAARCEYDFGDGSGSIIANPTHIYFAHGNYNVRFTAYNADGVSSTITKTISVGHYSLYKIVYTKLSGFYSNAPLNLELDYEAAIITSNISNFNQIPFTQDLGDNPAYDLTDTLAVQSYVERFSSNYKYADFYIKPSNMVNNVLDEKVALWPNDTAKFSLYFKIVPR